MSYTVEIAPAARRRIKKLPRAAQRRIVSALLELESEPRPPGAKKLAGKEDFYRIRVGRFRVIYRIQDEVLLVLVLKVGDRKEVYRSR